MSVTSHGPCRQQWCHLLMVLCGGLWWASSLTAGDPTFPVFVAAQHELELVTGERLCIDQAHFDKGGLSFRWQRNNRCRLPFACLRSLASPPGWRDRLWETFQPLRRETAPLTRDRGGVWSSTTNPAWHKPFEPALAAGGLSFAWKSPGNPKPEPAVHVTLAFESDATTAPLQLVLQSSGHVSVTLPEGWTKTFSQRRPPSTDWSRIAVVWQADRCEIELDSALLMICKRPAGALQKVTLEAIEPSTEVWIDDIVVREYRPDMAGLRASPRDNESVDILTLASGDRFFGTLAAAEESTPIVLDGEQVRWTGDWSDVVRIDFARRPLPPHCFTPVQGGLWDVTSLPGITEPLFLRNLHHRGHAVHHPWLGQLAWPASMPVQSTPVAWGEFRWLEPERRHLGDELRDDLVPVAPVGTSLSGGIEFTTPPAGPTWMVLDVSEMEPSGPETPPTQPFLDILRGGGLRTEVFINDQLVTDLNRYLRVRPNASHPERVWVPLPRSAWSAGQNTWTIRQQPLSPTQHQYDDTEIGRIGLWITRF